MLKTSYERRYLDLLEERLEMLCLFSALQTQKLGDYHKERKKLEKDFQSLEVLKRDCLALITSLKRRWS